MHDDDRHPGAPRGADGPGWSADVVVPDDISELQADIRAYHREVRARRRRERLRRIPPVRWWSRHGLPAPWILVALVLTGLVASALSLLLPRGLPARRAPSALASPAQHVAGSVGGLLPDVSLVIGGQSHSALQMRPAVLALLPAACGCAGLLDALAGQASEFRLQLVVVGPDAKSREPEQLAQRIRRGSAVAAHDPEGLLRQTYAATGVTVVLLAADGRVPTVVRDVGTQTRLEPQLTAMLGPTLSRTP